MKAISKRNCCRLCDSNKLRLALPIRPSPIGDAFVSCEQLNFHQESYPLDCYLCLDCGHLQNVDVVNPDILFSNYTYKSSISLGLTEHFRLYADRVISDLAISRDSFVVEMGSNDGTLLSFFKRNVMRVLGIDPAINISKQATLNGINTRNAFFTHACAIEILNEFGKADLFCANNVFAHIDNMSDIAKGIKAILSPDGIFVFEVSYIIDMIDNMVFDTIYHEHVSYHAILPLIIFFQNHGLDLFDAYRCSTKGGSIRCFVKHDNSKKYATSDSLIKLIEEEKVRDIKNISLYSDWFKKIEIQKEIVSNFIASSLKEGKKICGYGASTTTTTLIYHFELQDKLLFLVDDNIEKQGLYSPGAHIPVFQNSAIFEHNIDIVINLAWMYTQKILERNTKFINSGGVFISPLPTFSMFKSN